MKRARSETSPETAAGNEDEIRMIKSKPSDAMKRARSELLPAGGGFDKLHLLASLTSVLDNEAPSAASAGKDCHEFDECKKLYEDWKSLKATNAYDACKNPAFDFKVPPLDSHTLTLATAGRNPLQAAPVSTPPGFHFEETRETWERVTAERTSRPEKSMHLHEWNSSCMKQRHQLHFPMSNSLHSVANAAWRSQPSAVSKHPSGKPLSDDGNSDTSSTSFEADAINQGSHSENYNNFRLEEYASKFTAVFRAKANAVHNTPGAQIKKFQFIKEAYKEVVGREKDIRGGRKTKFDQMVERCFHEVTCIPKRTLKRKKQDKRVVATALGANPSHPISKAGHPFPLCGNHTTLSTMPVY